MAGKEGRGRHRQRSAPTGPAQPPWRLLKRRFDPVGVVSDDEVEHIHNASLEVLSDIGMEFLHPKALSMWADAGAKVDDTRVRIDPELICELVAHSPACLLYTSPSPRDRQKSRMPSSA